MSDKKTPSPGSQSKSDKPASPAEDVPTVTEKVEPGKATDEKSGAKSNFAKADQSRGRNGKSSTGKPAKAPRKGHGWLWFWLFLLVLIGAAIAAWYFIPTVRQQVNQQLQDVPVVGRFFDGRSTVAIEAPADSTAAQSTDSGSSAETTSSGETGSGDTTSTTPATPESGDTSASTPDTSAGADSTAQAEQPAWQATQQPDATSPKPPTPDTATNTATSPAPQPAPDHTAELQAQRQLIEQQSQAIAQLQRQLAGLQRNVTAQGNRLGQLGNASREDWQLAEADYLLRLASQRLKLEQDSRASLGLVQEVDKILRNLDLPDLYGVRQQLARDLTALKLVQNVDREGLYLRLRALEEQMLKLNIQPQFDLAKQAAIAASDDAAPGKANVESSWNNFIDFLKGSIRIRDAEVDPVLLSPQSEARFRQGLQLSMEQAELALLRGDETVYQDSLTRARELLQEYGVDTPQRKVILNELKELAGETVATGLPDLSASQTALRNYIDRLHKTSSGQDDSSSRIPGGDQ